MQFLTKRIDFLLAPLLILLILIITQCYSGIGQTWTAAIKNNTIILHLITQVITISYQANILNLY